MKLGKVALIITGSFAALVAAGLLAGAAWTLNANADSAGYIVTGEQRAQSATHAFVSDDLDVDSDFDWILDRGPKLRVSGESSEPLFIGIARTSDVERYLAGVDYDLVVDVDVDPSRSPPHGMPAPRFRPLRRTRRSGRQAPAGTGPRPSSGTQRAATGRWSS